MFDYIQFPNKHNNNDRKGNDATESYHVESNGPSNIMCGGVNRMVTLGSECGTHRMCLLYALMCHAFTIFCLFQVSWLRMVQQLLLKPSRSLLF
jgi:hypothetical protein